MGFSSYLHGRVNHDQLLTRQEAELRLLDSIKRCVSSKIKCDREYALSINILVNQGLKMEKQEDYQQTMANSILFNAWKIMLEELDNIGKVIRQNTDNIENKLIMSLANLCQEKRRVKKLYQERHSKLNQQFNQLAEDVNKKKIEYQKYQEVYKLMRSKFEDHYVKAGKSGRKLDDVREKYQKACRRLHVTHNEYVLLLCEAVEFEKGFRTVLLPNLMEHQHKIQEAFIESLKTFLLNIVKESLSSVDKIKEIHQKIWNTLSSIISTEEYKDLKDKPVAAEPSSFLFDKNLVENSVGGKLTPNELTVDNLTVEWLRTKLSLMELNLKKNEEKRKCLKTKRENDVGNIKEDAEVESHELALDINSSMIECTQRELIELDCYDLRLNKQVELIRRALNELGCEEAPSACDLSLDNQFFHQDNIDQVPPVVINKSLVDEEWFHGVLPREEVVRLLSENGDYLVRETLRNDEYQTVLSVCWNGHKHFIVQTTPDSTYRFEGPAFGSIRELILYQHNSGLPITSRSGAILKRSVPKERWELKNDDVILQDKIGRGNFGDVYKAQLKNCPNNDLYHNVAVKTCRLTLPDDQKRKFLQEGSILKQYDHPNIVKLIGICVQKQPIMIVMELVPGGSLLSFLRKQTTSFVAKDFLKMCLDAAAGMRYLESKNCIHRDLAARNCLIGSNNIVKISDFGMSREEEEYTVSDGMKQIPIKWTAPEALNYGKYTSLCDVWSYGVLCWEIFSKGETPYRGMSNSKARENIDAGYRMPAPDDTPAEMYRLMLQCWEYTPELRPNFEQIHGIIEKLVGSFID